MATYIEKHSIVTEDTLNVDHNSRETFQHVKFMNPQNEYCGFITSNSYHIVDDQSKTTYNMSVKDGHLLLSSNAGEVKLVDFSQIKDILSYDAVEDQASIPSIKLLSALHSMYIAEMQKLNSSKVTLSGENEISGENAIEQLSSKLIVTDELSTAQLSVATLNDFFADGKSLSSILQNTGANVAKLCADLSSEVSNLSNALSDELNTLSIDVKDHYYTIDQTNKAINRVAAYYITKADGNPFSTLEELIEETQASALYSGGVLRYPPTRNDYAVVLSAGDTRNEEWRYIFIGDSEEDTGLANKWQPQYLIETNDYAALVNKPKINNVELIDNVNLYGTNIMLSTGSTSSITQLADYAAKTAIEALDNYHPLSNKQYDFNDQNSINTALYDIISALGGTVVNFSPSSKEQDAIRELYPEGTVESIDQLTHGLKYEFNDDEHTASLLAFANDNSANNSFASGAVIVPPYVDKQGNVSLFNDDNFYKVTLIAGTEDTYSDNLTLKSIISPSTVLSVEGGAFANCVELTSAMFKHIKYIGNNAFDYCEKLKTADVYTAEYIGQYAFANCILLDISMPLNCLSTVSKGAFSYCENLSSITLPLLEVVEQNTFEQCYNLSSIFLPAVKHINAAFDGAVNIKVINFGNELENLPTFSNSAFNDIKCKFIVPDNLYDSLEDSSWSVLYYDSNYEFVKYSENA